MNAQETPQVVIDLGLRILDLDDDEILGTRRRIDRLVRHGRQQRSIARIVDGLTYTLTKREK